MPHGGRAYTSCVCVQAPADSWDDYYCLVFDAIHTRIFKTEGM